MKGLRQLVSHPTITVLIKSQVSNNLKCTHCNWLIICIDLSGAIPTAFEQAPPAGLYSSGFSTTPKPTSFSMSPTPVPNLYAQPTSTTGGFSGGNSQPGFGRSIHEASL